MVLFCILNLSKGQDSSTSNSLGNNCYTFHDVDSTWEEARDACRKMGAHLVTMETIEEWEKVKSLIADKVKKSGSYTHWYIGLRKESGMWKWTEAGSPGVVVSTGDDRWQRNQPSSIPGAPEENCGEINSEHPPRVYSHFNNLRCNIKYVQRGYICENF